MVVPSIENGEQPFPAIVARAWCGFDVGLDDDFGIVTMLREHRLVFDGQCPVIKQHDLSARQMVMQRFDRYQIGQQHGRTDHRKQDKPVFLCDDWRCIQYPLNGPFVRPRACFPAHCRNDFHQGQPVIPSAQTCAFKCVLMQRLFRHD